MTLNDARYLQWEKDVSDEAYKVAEEYMEDYKNGVKYIQYKTTKSKAVEEYLLMKVWQLLECNGIFMGIQIRQRKDKVFVYLDFSPNPT
jgi:hypothetical protein